MKIAYIIAAHKCSTQLKLLLNQLNCNENDIYIHIDKKNDELYKDIKETIKYYSNISLIQNRIAVYKKIVYENYR